MFLTPNELQTLTGYRRHSCQRSWLDKAGVGYFVSKDGKPHVLRTELERRTIPAHGATAHQRLRLAATRL